MRTVWKVAVAPKMNAVALPAGAIPLAVQMQDDVPQMWFLVDPERPKEPRSFLVVGTGQPIPDDVPLHFIGTFQMAPEGLVWHLFEVTNAPRRVADR